MHSSTKLYLLLLVITLLMTPYIYSKVGDPAYCKSEKVCTGRDSKACKRGSLMRLVVELNNDHNNSRFYGFCVKVDQFSVLNLFGSGSFMNASANSTVTLHIGDDESDDRFYMNEDGTAIVSQYTAIVGLKKGLFARSNSSFSNIVFESTCSRNVCVMDRSAPCIRGDDCGITFASLASKDANTTQAIQDVKLYLAWEGTDRISAALRSASLLPNRFSAYSFASYYQQLYNSISNNFKNREYDNTDDL